MIPRVSLLRTFSSMAISHGFSAKYVKDKELRRDLNRAFTKIAREAKRFWHSEAGRRLKSSRKDYQATLSTQKIVGGHAVILGGKGTKRQKALALSVELGSLAFDMKPGLLKGEKWRVIPLNPTRAVINKKPIFRTVTPAQKGMWIHPGIRAYNISINVENYIDRVLIPKYIDPILEKYV